MEKIKEKVKIRYLGTSSIFLKTPGFFGKVAPGGTAEIYLDIYNKDLKTHKKWELIKENNKKKKGED